MERALGSGPACARADPVFAQLLDTLYGGAVCPMTTELLWRVAFNCFHRTGRTRDTV